MGKYLLSSIPDEQEVLIDVPEGYMRMSGYMDYDTGEGQVIFSESASEADVGERVMHEEVTRPLMRIRVQSPEKALSIARIFLELAARMDDWYNIDDEEDDDEDFDEDCECCPGRESCYIMECCDEDDDDSNG